MTYQEYRDKVRDKAEERIKHAPWFRGVLLNTGTIRSCYNFELSVEIGAHYVVFDTMLFDTVSHPAKKV